MYRIETKNNKTFLELTVKPANFFYRLILLIFALAPLLSIIGFSQRIATPFALFIIFIFFGAMSLFLFRMLLWNIYGKQLYIMSKTEFTSVNDYGWFKDNSKTITPITDFDVVFIDLNKPSELLEFNETNLNTVSKKNEYVIVFVVNQEKYQSVLKQSPESLKKFGFVIPEIKRDIMNLEISLS
ncbi:hypothetical protein [Flavobacterium beibuense]|uniref:Uncharacterized protein n=1 Tax=Flavobacterium beibuense TaxID=657326 RepID=A0A444W965_9FLAO|nr:hypothetical protein [Flavobacterium beibuense]RYJ42429.1 hypothetical protein NU09_2215 [Flavobacterium beibuense]